MSEMQYIMFIPFYLYFIQDVHNEKDMIFGLWKCLANFRWSFTNELECGVFAGQTNASSWCVFVIV